MRRSRPRVTPIKPSIFRPGPSARKRLRRIGAALAELPRRQREAVHYLMLGEKSLDETAVLTGRSKGSLKVNLHRALKALRLKMDRGA
jgi:DNA-directed RNA polymerase specialized sigma24 family protein